MHKNKLGLIQALEDMSTSADVFKTYFTHGTLEVELYKPDQIDHQKPHERDEIYIIANGEGQFILEGEVMHVKSGDFLFVPAGKEHRFVDFTEDFSTWVIFYGPNGGEQGEVINLL